MQTSWTRFLPILPVILIGVMALAIAGRTFLGWTPIGAFKPFAISFLLCIPLVLFGLLMIGWGVFRKKRYLLANGAEMAVIAFLPVITVLLLLGPDGFTKPPIHDITTDTANPPRFEIATQHRGDKENSLDYAGEPVAAVQRQAYPQIQPLMSPLPPDQALLRAIETINERGWLILNIDPEQGLIEAVDESRIFGFKDDVAIRIRAEDPGSRLDLRSVSRVGKGDFGANAERIRRFIAAFQE